MFLKIFNFSLNPGSQYFVLIDPTVSSIIFSPFVTILLLNNCTELRKLVTNTKEASGDEFLVIKKQPLTIPPDFDKIPVPISEENLEEVDQITISENEIENLLKDISSKSKAINDDKISEDLENSILQKIE